MILNLVPRIFTQTLVVFRLEDKAKLLAYSAIWGYLVK